MARILFEVSERDGVRRAVTTACQVVAEERFELLGDRTIDLSLEGMLVEARAASRVGEEVIVSLRAPGTQLWLDLEGTVTRIVCGRRRADRRRAVALRFRGMSRLYRTLLESSLRGRPPPLPARARRKDYARTVFAIAGS